MSLLNYDERQSVVLAESVTHLVALASMLPLRTKAVAVEYLRDALAQGGLDEHEVVFINAAIKLLEHGPSPVRMEYATPGGRLCSGATLNG